MTSGLYFFFKYDWKIIYEVILDTQAYFFYLITDKITLTKSV